MSENDHPKFHGLLWLGEKTLAEAEQYDPLYYTYVVMQEGIAYDVDLKWKGDDGAGNPIMTVVNMPQVTAVHVYRDVLWEARYLLEAIQDHLARAVDAKRTGIASQERHHLERAEQIGYAVMSILEGNQRDKEDPFDYTYKAYVDLFGEAAGSRLKMNHIRNATYLTLDGTRTIDSVQIYVGELLADLQVPELPSPPPTRLQLDPAFQNHLVTGDVKNDGDWHRCISIARGLLNEAKWDGKRPLHICGNVDEIHRQMTFHNAGPLVRVIDNRYYAYHNIADIPVALPSLKSEKPYIVYNHNLYADAIHKIGIDHVKEECIAGRFATMEAAAQFAEAQAIATGDSFAVVEPHRVPAHSPIGENELVALRNRAQMLSDETHDWKAKYDAQQTTIHNLREELETLKDDPNRRMCDRLNQRHKLAKLLARRNNRKPVRLLR